MSTTIQEQSDALKAASAQRLPAAVLETVAGVRVRWSIERTADSESH